jgi:hypothetical protein
MAGRIGYYGGVVKDGLVLDLDAAKLDSYPRTGTSWKDISGNQNNGTLINGPTFDSGNGGSIVFDGSNDRVNLGTSSNLKFTTNFTISIWLKFNSTAGTQTIISNNSLGGYGIISQLTPSSRVQTYYYINGVYYNVGEQISNYNTNSWYNIVSTFNGSTISYYRNSVLIQSTNIVGSVTTTSEPLTIGANPESLGSTFSDFFNGRIATIQLYNKPLSPQEVLQNYNATKKRFGL